MRTPSITPAKIAGIVFSGSLYLNKLEGVKFFVGVFTNLTRDHLDFFKDMHSYGKTKALLFNKGRCKFAVINSDDAFGIELINSIDSVITYGIDNPADVFAIKIKEKSTGTDFIINLFDSRF